PGSNKYVSASPGKREEQIDRVVRDVVIRDRNIQPPFTYVSGQTVPGLTVLEKLDIYGKIVSASASLEIGDTVSPFFNKQPGVYRFRDVIIASGSSAEQHILFPAVRCDYYYRYTACFGIAL